eukprot:jgi/Botrbrau1/8423/Bobra.0237s0043.1
MSSLEGLKELYSPEGSSKGHCVPFGSNSSKGLAEGRYGCANSKSGDADGGVATIRPSFSLRSPSSTSGVPRKKLRTDAKVRDVYKIGRTLGTGGFAVVKLGTDRTTGEEFAIKIMVLPEAGAAISDHENSREDIRKEIDILVQLNHPNVIFLKEYFEEQGRVYLVTEVADGGRVAGRCAGEGLLHRSHRPRLLCPIAAGIAYLHSIGIGGTGTSS